MRHKWADVLIAIANGQEVEVKLNENWVKANNFLNSYDPLTNDDLEWRIKKEPVITVKYFRLESHPLLGLRYDSFTPDLEEWNLKVTFEDGIAIKAELPTRT